MKSGAISFEGVADQKIACEVGMKFVFDASVGEAEFTRDGSDLVITKGDMVISLTDFYDVYNKDEQPSFEIDGVDIASADFFEAMNATDLQPVAGPGGSQSVASVAAGGGRYSAYDDTSLLDGISNLGPHDIGFNGEPPIHEYLASAGRKDGDVDIDNVPQGKPDHQEMTEDTGLVVSGDVPDGDVAGAEGFGRIEWTGLEAGSPYELGKDGSVILKETGQKVGTLSLNEDGSYAFELDPGCDAPKGEMPHLVVDYILFNKDGDSSCTTLEIAIKDIELTEVGSVINPVKTYETIYGEADNDWLFSLAGDDHIYGGAGHDPLHGDSENISDTVSSNDGLDGAFDEECLDREDGSDTFNGDTGNIILIYDSINIDKAIDGRDVKDIDFLMSTDMTVSIDKLLTNVDSAKGQLVRNIEVIVKGDDADKITSLTDLDDKGIKVNGTTVELSNAWEADKDNPQVFTNVTEQLTLETTLTNEGEDVVTQATILALKI